MKDSFYANGNMGRNILGIVGKAETDTIYSNQIILSIVKNLPRVKKKTT
jgi:hypothetical protein